MGTIYGLTGTPGTGKKSTAPRLASLLGVRCVSINDIANSSGLVEGPRNEWGVDTDRLRKRLDNIAGPAVVYGHLLPYAISARSVTRVAVLRCEPAVLKMRLMERRYSSRKVKDNVESELIGQVSADAYEAFGEAKAFEVDTSTSSPDVCADAILRIIGGKTEPGPRIDWTVAYDTGAKLRSLLSPDMK